LQVNLTTTCWKHCQCRDCYLQDFIARPIKAMHMSSKQQRSTANTSRPDSKPQQTFSREQQQKTYSQGKPNCTGDPCAASRVACAEQFAKPLLTRSDACLPAPTAKYSTVTRHTTNGVDRRGSPSQRNGECTVTGQSRATEC
jgi:hypothetical protein